MASCECKKGSFGNSGYEGSLIPGRIVSVVMVPLFANDGTRNGHDVTVDFDQTYLDSMLTNADPSKRWYPYTNIKEATITAGAPIYDTSSDNSKEFVGNEVTTFEGELKTRPFKLACKFNSLRCKQMGIFLVDDCGAFHGGSLESDVVYPISIGENTANALIEWATATTASRIRLTFDFNSSFKACDVTGIPNDYITADLVNMRGMISVYATVSAITTTGFRVTYTSDYGSAKNKAFGTGFVWDAVPADSNFVLEEVSPSAATITVTSVIETATGSAIYDFVFPAETSADELLLTTTALYMDFEPETIIIP